VPNVIHPLDFSDLSRHVLLSKSRGAF
jgi:hypothetical protein